KAVSYACKATDSCCRCGVCVAHDRISEALLHPRVAFLRGVAIESVERTAHGHTVRGFSSNPTIHHQDCTLCGACVTACPAAALSLYSRGGLSFIAIDFSVCLLHSGRSCSACAEACPAGAIAGSATRRRRFAIRADGILIATGHDTFSPVSKPRLGYGRFPGVMTGLEAEQALSRRAWLPSGADASVPARSVAFVQCVGSRDPSLRRNFCSSVCCAYALRMARLLASRNPATEVAVYFIDIQNFDKVFTPFRAELEGMGVRFVRGIPASIARASDGRLALSIEDASGHYASAVHDTVVLSTGVAPSEGAARLADLFGLERDESGFLRSKHAEIRVAGTCGEPRSIADSISSARAAALEMVR
ncbi:MAG TPA: 4Fe-4S dicluster domain-containing protein, partial [Spirochaetia bacterium]|nr:4Fe-4S dicluster domain-containing protein [Spirochaetia bacterium]